MNSLLACSPENILLSKVGARRFRCGTFSNLIAVGAPQVYMINQFYSASPTGSKFYYPLISCITYSHVLLICFFSEVMSASGKVLD